MSETKPAEKSKQEEKKTDEPTAEPVVYYPDVATGHMNPKPKEKK